MNFALFMMIRLRLEMLRLQAKMAVAGFAIWALKQNTIHRLTPFVGRAEAQNIADAWFARSPQDEKPARDEKCVVINFNDSKNRKDLN